VSATIVRAWRRAAGLGPSRRRGQMDVARVRPDTSPEPFGRRPFHGETIWLQRFFVLFFIDLGSRRVLRCARGSSRRCCATKIKASAQDGDPVASRTRQPQMRSLLRIRGGARALSEIQERLGFVTVEILCDDMRAERYEQGDVARYSRGSKGLGIERGDYARVEKRQLKNDIR
jgi:hypothetical protein